MSQSPGKVFKECLAQHQPLQIVGCINAYAALQAKRAGFSAIYLSGAGVANASFGLPDLAMTNLTDVVTDARRITSRVDLPLLVDIDTGFGSALMLSRSINELIRAGVAAVHIEDQVAAKRCGHRPNKTIVDTAEMVDRIRIASESRQDPDFVIMARTDAIANEGLSAAIERMQAYVRAGADMLFPEAVSSIEEYRVITDAVKVPVLANLTEFGKTPLCDLAQLKSANVAMALYPLSAFRAMSKAAEKSYQAIKQQGTQQAIIDQMQTREELYDTLDYHHFEATIDKLNEQGE